MTTFPPDLLRLVKHLPHLPGVYRMLDNSGVVLYVGKARDLSKRVKSYFHQKNHSPRIKLMLSKVTTIATTVTRNEVEALVLENNLIKSLHPKYNIYFRDDKSYPLIKISQHTYPQISYFRGKQQKPHLYFGPYPNGQYAKNSIYTIQKIFKLRTCEDTVFNHRTRPCLLFQIKRCSAPCTNEISATDYQYNVEQAILFLTGKTDSLIQKLSKKMEQASAQLDFEIAAHYRDQILSLTKIQNNQFINSQQNSQANLDILSCASIENFFGIQLISIRNGQYIGDKNFVLDNSQLANDSITHFTESFLAQHYLSREKPDQIITDFPVSTIIQEALNQEHPRKIQFLQQVLGERKKWLSMAQKNALLAIQQKQLSSQSQKTRVSLLQDLLKIERLNRIECFDVSHTFGEATVASCVVYQDYSMQPSEYRRYNIKNNTLGDDYHALYEALTRCYQNHPNPPDLVLIDGGTGQVNTALKVWYELGLSIPLVGIAKGPERKAGLEKLIIPSSNKIIQLEPDNPALHLLQTIRDEAHRFAITGHRKQRDNNRKKSKLDDIPLIGPKRKKALLIRFGGLREIENASIEELMQVEGINQAIATKIHHYLHSY